MSRKIHLAFQDKSFSQINSQKIANNQTTHPYIACTHIRTHLISFFSAILLTTSFVFFIIFSSLFFWPFVIQKSITFFHPCITYATANEYKTVFSFEQTNNNVVTFFSLVGFVRWPFFSQLVFSRCARCSYQAMAKIRREKKNCDEISNQNGITNDYVEQQQNLYQF